MIVKYELVDEVSETYWFRVQHARQTSWLDNIIFELVKSVGGNYNVITDPNYIVLFNLFIFIRSKFVPNGNRGNLVAITIKDNNVVNIYFYTLTF
jgi:hypothetical protein